MINAALPLLGIVPEKWRDKTVGEKRNDGLKALLRMKAMVKDELYAGQARSWSERDETVS